jgi:condensin complex subunit 3
MNLFLHCFTRGHGTLQVVALQCITDVLIAHPSLFTEAPDTSNVGSEQSEANDTSKLVLKAFSKSLKSADPIVQAIGAAGLAKAMLSRLITDSDLLKQLVITFFDPDSASNAQLRQSLSYFLPVYCHSRADNATRMATIACSVIGRLTTLRDARLEDDDADAATSPEAMVSISQVANMLLDWTDPRKIVGYVESSSSTTAAAATTASDAHFVLAEAILERLVTSQLNRDERKVLLNMLSKLHLPPGVADAETLKTILELLTEAVDSGVATDKTGENILAKLREGLMKLVHDVMTLERGGGDTIAESTEVAGEDEDEGGNAAASGSSRTGNKLKEDDEDEDGEEDEEDEDENDVTAQLQREMRDNTTVGFTTAIVPDAEGTRINLLGGEGQDEDSEMMDV